MAKITETRNQTIVFETSPEELRKLADTLEKTKENLSVSEATFFLGTGKEDDFDDSVCIRFVKEKVD